VISRKVVHIGWNLEYLMFLFTRLSGASILILAAVGLVMAFIMGARQQMDLGTLLRWTFFPNPNHVVNTVADVQAGWQNGFWEVMQILIVFFGVTHGINGLRVVLEDYIKGNVLQTIVRVGLFLLWIFIFVFAIYVIRAG